jgi:hypothetical protein
MISELRSSVKGRRSYFRVLANNEQFAEFVLANSRGIIQNAGSYFQK